MKVIVTGATGWAGKAVIAECISNPVVSCVLALTRRPIEDNLSKSEKVKVVIHEDFEEYPAEILEKLQGAEACIWCLGGKAEDFPDIATARHVGVDLTIAGANAILKHLAPTLGAGKRFVFAFCSGKGAEWDQSKSLWILPHTRRIKGEVERGLLDLAEANPTIFDVVILRPGGIMPNNSLLANSSSSLFVPVSDLAKAFVKVCRNPPKDKVIENSAIIKAARS